VKYNCAACKSSRAVAPSSPPMKKRKEAKIKLEPNWKQTPEVKQDPDVEIKQEPCDADGDYDTGE
jgi:hypothetical protein